MLEVPLVPVFYHPEIETAQAALQACYDGGVRVMEFTNRGDFAHEVFAKLLQYATDQCPEMILGIGSVVDPGTTSLYLQNGANFIVSPILNPDMAKVCNRRKVLWAPGCATLSEISTAEELGAEIVKIFPGSVVGPAFVKAIKGPNPWSSIMPTGGVSPDEDNLRSWFEAGVSCVGMGSKLLRKDFVAAGDWDRIRQMVQDCLAIIRSVQN